MNHTYKKVVQGLMVVLLIAVIALGYRSHSLNIAYAEELTEHSQTQEKVTKKESELDEQSKTLDKVTKEKEAINAEKAAAEKEKEEAKKAKIELEKKVEKLEQDLKAKLEKEKAEQLAVKETVQTSSQQEPKVEPVSSTPEPKSEPEPVVEEQAATGLGTFTVTHYATGDGMTPSTTTANGTEVANTIYTPEGYRIIAVDTSVIPLNSIVRVTINGQTFIAQACDTGSAINGNKIDLLVSSPSEALSLGLTTATIEIIE